MDYKLYTRQSKSKFFFKLKDEGVSLGDNAISWTSGNVVRTRPYSDIAEVNPMVSFAAKMGYSGNCLITFRDGDAVNIMAMDSIGLPDNDRTRTYGDFLKAFHQKLVPHQNGIRFNAGTSGAIHKFRVVALIVAVLFFLVTPVTLFLITEQPKVLLATAGGAVLTLGLFRVVRANKPREYKPTELPDTLIPLA